MKLSAKNEKKLATLIQTIRISNRDIGIIFGIKMYHTHNEKWKKINNEKNRTAK